MELKKKYNISKISLIAVYACISFFIDAHDLSFAKSNIPQLINYQGFLSENEQPLNGNVNVTFNLYEVPVDGAALWSETQNISVNQGRFSVLLGSVDPENNPLPFYIFKDGDIYIGIKVEDDDEMTPRQQIVSVPYAMHSANANGTLKRVVSGETISGGTLPVPVFQDTSDGEFYACDADDIDKTNYIGFATSSGENGDEIDVQFEGIVDGFSGLQKGKKYYVQDAVGTIGTSMGSFEVLVGTAISDKELLIQKGNGEFIGQVSGTFGGNYPTSVSGTINIHQNAHRILITVNSGCYCTGGGNLYGPMGEFEVQKGIKQQAILRLYNSGGEETVNASLSENTLSLSSSLRSPSCNCFLYYSVFFFTK